MWTDMRMKTRHVKTAESDRQDAMVFSLQKQINAHFTINALNSIRILMEQGELTKAGTIINGLTALFRYSYDNNETINIWDELDILQRYVTIMNIWYEDKFDVIFDFDERLMEHSMPRMLLQPVIENAMVHGFKDIDSCCVISITAKPNGDTVVFTVTDNGSGMNSDELDALHEKLSDAPETARGYENVALLNIRNRLHYAYGVNAGLEVAHSDGGGIRTMIQIPKI